MRRLSLTSATRQTLQARQDGAVPQRLRRTSEHKERNCIRSGTRNQRRSQRTWVMCLERARRRRAALISRLVDFDDDSMPCFYDIFIQPTRHACRNDGYIFYVEFEFAINVSPSLLVRLSPSLVNFQASSPAIYRNCFLFRFRVHAGNLEQFSNYRATPC